MLPVTNHFQYAPYNSTDPINLNKNSTDEQADRWIAGRCIILTAIRGRCSKTSLLDDRRAAFPPSLSIIIAVFYATSVGIYLRGGSGKKEHCEETEMCFYQCTDLGTCWYHLIYDILLHEAKRDAVFKAEKILFFR